MMFLRSANRASTRYAKVRQLLILLCRVLTVATLVLALSRPLSGGWMGWMVSPAPDVILIALDRSASMETKAAGSQTTKREQALQLLGQAAKTFQGTSGSCCSTARYGRRRKSRAPTPLPALSQTSATDTAADMPTLLQAAYDWLHQDRSGKAELWIASDLQQSNWRPDSQRWPALASALAAMPLGARVRLLALNEEGGPNASIAVQEVTRRQRAGQADLDLALEIQRNATQAAALPLTVTVDGVRSQQELTMDGRSLRIHHHVNLGDKTTGGWGTVELPADANGRDNISYFVYGPQVLWRTGVVSSDAPSRDYLSLAAAPAPKELNEASETVPVTTFARASLSDYALIIWQEPFPGKEIEPRLRAFVEDGGVVAFFPSGQADAQKFDGTGWGEVQTAPARNRGGLGAGRRTKGRWPRPRKAPASRSAISPCNDGRRSSATCSRSRHSKTARRFSRAARSAKARFCFAPRCRNRIGRVWAKARCWCR